MRHRSVSAHTSSTLSLQPEGTSAYPVRILSLRRTVSVWTVSSALVAVTVFCFTLGSSSVPGLIALGGKLRWVTLFALAIFAAAAVVRLRPPLGRGLALTLALATWFGALVIASTAWSVLPRLTFERAASFGVMLIAVASLAVLAHSRPERATTLLVGVLAGAVLVALGGLVVLALHHEYAVQPAGTQQPTRYMGLGENPDTVAMLEAVASPVALWLTFRERRRCRQAFAGAALLLLLGSIIASNSRGGLVAGGAGAVAVATAIDARDRSRRIAYVATVCVLFVVSVVVMRIPKPLSPAAAARIVLTTATTTTTLPTTTRTTMPTRTSPPLTATTVTPKTTPPPLAPERDTPGRLSDEIGYQRVGSSGRPLFGTSGRFQAWAGAIGQADERPLLGYGFGTESPVFVDRYYVFQGGHVENSFIGLYLQMGAIGLLCFFALGTAFVYAVVVLARRNGPGAPALAGIIAAGVTLMGVQSYIYSVGNVATISVWLAGFLAAGLASAT